MYRSLLVPLDGSSFAEQALRVAADIAARAKATLHLVLVHQASAVVAGPGEPVVLDPAIDQKLRETRPWTLNELCSTIRRGPMMPRRM